MKLYSTREINKIAYKKTHSTNISNEINSHYTQEIKMPVSEVLWVDLLEWKKNTN